MSDAKNAKKWSIEQEKYIKFLAAGKKDTTGKVWSKEAYAAVLGVHPTTLSRWQSDVAFRMAVLDETMGRYADFLPAMVQAQIKKAIKSGDTPAFMAVMRQGGVIKSDKHDHTITEVPVPILGGPDAATTVPARVAE